MEILLLRILFHRVFGNKRNVVTYSVFCWDAAGASETDKSRLGPGTGDFLGYEVDLKQHHLGEI
jgi:hypothetical protein